MLHIHNECGVHLLRFRGLEDGDLCSYLIGARGAHALGNCWLFSRAGCPLFVKQQPLEQFLSELQTRDFPQRNGAGCGCEFGHVTMQLCFFGGDHSGII